MRQTMIKIIKYCMIPFGMFHALLHRKSNLTILMYHRVNDHVSKEISVSRKNFVWQMEYLRRKGYRVVSLDEAIRLWRDEYGGRAKYAVLTFDDGYEDFYSSAFPVLCKYDYPATLYLVPGYIETGKVYWWDTEIGESRLMNWTQIRELISSGVVTIGSHSMSHLDFNKITPEEINEELSRSKELLQEKLSIEINHFSYPRGIVTAYSREAAKKLYQTAVSIFDGYELMQSKQDDILMQLKRLPTQGSDGMFLFSARLKGWLVLEEWIKKYLIRY